MDGLYKVREIPGVFVEAYEKGHRVLFGILPAAVLRCCGLEIMRFYGEFMFLGGYRCHSSPDAYHTMGGGGAENSERGSVDLS